MGSFGITVSNHQDGGEPVGWREAGDKIERQILPQARGNRKGLEQASGFAGFILHLLADEALRNYTMDITVHVIPEEGIVEAAKSFSFTHVATQGSGVEFLQKHGDGGVVGGQPQFAAKVYSTGNNGVVRMGLGLLLKLG